MHNDSTRTFYESEKCDWFPAYHYFKFANEGFENRAIHTLMSGAENSFFLDNGCGDGRLINKVIKYPIKRIVGMDISKRQLVLAKKSINDERVNLVRGCISALPFKDGTFDRLLCWSVLIHIENEISRDSALKEMSRTLKPDGKIAINIKNYPALIYHVFSFIYWYLKSIITIFNGSGFQHSKKNLQASIKKSCYHKVSWSANEVLFLQRFTMSDVKNKLARSNMHFISRSGQGFFLPDGFDMLLEKVMRYIVIGRILGKFDNVLSRLAPFFTDNIVYFIVKNRQ